MSYIRTKDGVYKVVFVSPLGFVRIDKRDGTYPDVFEKDIIKQADTVDELIDELIDMVDGKPIIESDENCVFLSCQKMLGKIKEVFGAVWLIGKNNVPILKSVAKENEEGKLELLCVEKPKK